MKKKLMALAIALGLSMAAMTGCGKPTVESLVDGMFDSEIESQTVEVEMDIVLSAAASGISVDIGMDGDFEMQISGMNGKEQITYVDGKLGMNAMGQNESVGFEAYAVVDDGTVTAYAYDEDSDTWYKTETESDGSDALDQDTIDEITEAMKDVLKENGELAEDTEKVEGEECYVITATVEGGDWSAILKPMQGMIDDAMEEADVDIDVLSWFEYFSADITYYISKDTGYLVKSEVDMSDTDLFGMVKQMAKDIGVEEYFGDVTDMIEDCSFSKFYLSAVFSDINDTEVEVPDDVIDNAVEKNVADSIDGLMGGVGNDPIGDDPFEDDPFEDDPFGNDPYETDPDDGDWFHGDSFTFHKADESDEFLCEVKIPDGYSYDVGFSDPESGMVSLDRDAGDGWIWIQNEVEPPMYYGLLNNGKLPVDEYPSLADYEDYEMEMKVVGHRIWRERCYLSCRNLYGQRRLGL